jgi:hypothetical protein
MSNVNIFEKASPNSGEFFKFKNIGDSIQGTYINKSEGVDSYNNTQFIYAVKDSEGKVWNVAFRKEAAFVNERMEGAKFGQIVGFRFDEERDSKKMPGKKAKIIRIYADEQFVDQDWINARKNLDSCSGQEETPVEESEIEAAMNDAFKSPADAVAASGVLPEDDKKNNALEAVRQLARTKGITSSELPIQEQDNLIVAFSGLPLTEENLTQVIIKITGHKA